MVFLNRKFKPESDSQNRVTPVQHKSQYEPRKTKELNQPKIEEKIEIQSYYNDDEEEEEDELDGQYITRITENQLNVKSNTNNRKKSNGLSKPQLSVTPLTEQPQALNENPKNNNILSELQDKVAQLSAEFESFKDNQENNIILSELQHMVKQLSNELGFLKDNLKKNDNNNIKRQSTHIVASNPMPSNSVSSHPIPSNSVWSRGEVKAKGSLNKVPAKRKSPSRCLMCETPFCSEPINTNNIHVCKKQLKVKESLNKTLLKRRSPSLNSLSYDNDYISNKNHSIQPKRYTTVNRPPIDNFQGQNSVQFQDPLKKPRISIHFDEN